MTESLQDATKPQLNGAERAAIVLHELGEEVAAVVMRQMDEHAIARISGAMTRQRKIPAAARNEVLDAFESDLGIGGGDEDGYRYLSKVLVSALGETRAQDIINRLSRTERSSFFHLQAIADPRTLAMQMVGERPQTLALLLAQLPRDAGAAMLSYLPEKLAADTIYRFTTLDTVSPEAVNELREMMTELLANSDSGGRRLANLGGAKPAADILNHLQSGLSERVLEAINAHDSETADKIRENLFTFLDLVRLPDRSLQILMREVPGDRLAPALRLVDESVRARFYQNMSARTIEVLQEELTNGPPIRRADALSAQGEIVEIALRLSAEGRISVNASEELV